MKRLVAFQVRHKISILVLSHDSTPAATRVLVNLADSEIAVTDPTEKASAKKIKAGKKEVAKKTVTRTHSSTPLTHQDPDYDPDSYCAYYCKNDNPYNLGYRTQR